MNLLTEKKEVVNKARIHQGDLLELIRKHFALSHKEFAYRLEITYAWEHKLIKKSVIPENIKMMCKKAFGVNEDFWKSLKSAEGLLGTLEVKPFDGVKYDQVKAENDKLKESLLAKDQEIQYLQKKVIDLLEKDKK